jgi:hypothetical protein
LLLGISLDNLLDSCFIDAFDLFQSQHVVQKHLLKVQVFHELGHLWLVRRIGVYVPS